ncbi:MAG: hypothetical protein KUG73_08475, partial [Pseudomonadales bacterium]|nr:hypothetical protein [Pseudomonadales bacterium]
ATEIWFPIQKTFGPIHIGQIGVKWHDSGNEPGNKALEILLDGGVSLAGLNVYVDDLGVRIPIASASDLSTWSLGLKGLGVSYVGGGVKISGALLRDNPEGTAYSGAVLVEVSGKTFTAIGSYAKDPVTSMFVFVLLPITIGGPPYFFITGLAGGFGYNRGLNVPPVEDIPEFPLIEAARGSSAFSNNPLSALSRLGDAVPVKRGSYWIAGGIKFSSFELAKSTALAYILLDRGFEVGILGITRMELPEENPLVNLELALKARFSTRDGVLSVEARLSDNSWLFDRDCRLTGGFAFYVWFGGLNQGDFVITVGGYHHRFNKPSHYPDVPRLGFNWRVSSKVTIKGESYFALTPSAVMAGGLLEAVYKSGNLKAWFKAWAHFLIAWKPFAYAIGFGISIGVSYRLRINLLFGSITKTFKVELGASVEIWGPKFSGIATINWWVISFDVRFGGNVGKDKKDAISWDIFRKEFLPEDNKDIISADVITGTLVDEKGENDTEKVSPWILQPEFRFSTSTLIATNKFNLFGKKDIFRGDVDIRPMHRNNVLSSHHINIKNKNGGSVFELPLGDVEPVDLGNDTWRFTTDNDGFIDVLLKTERAPAALWDFEDGEQKADAKTISTFTGVEIIAEIDENRTDIEKTGQIPVKDIIERGIHPLPFFQELADRSDVQSFSDTADLALPNHTDARGIFVAASHVLGPVWNERRNSLLDQLDALGVNVTQNETLRQSPEALSRNVTSPPKIVSLYEGMANDAIPSTEIDVIEVLEIAPIQLVPLTPRLIAILKQRPEPVVSIRKSQPTRVTERVSDIESSRNQVIPRIKVNQKLSQKVFGAKLNRVSSPTQTKQSVAVSQRAEFVLSGHSTSRIKQQFKVIEKISIATEIPAAIAPETVAPVTVASAATSLANTVSHQPQRSQSNVINAGTTQVWNLPSRNTRGEQSMMHISGNQGVKISTLNRGGVLLTEKEFGSGDHQWQPPHKTARIAITGLGKIQSEKLKVSQAASMGAITLGESNNGFAAVGWQQHSQLVQISKLTLLGRGAVVHLNAPLELTRKGRVVRQAIVDASDITRSNDTFETLLPSNVDLVCIQIQSPSASTTQDISEALGISSPELVLSDKPLSIIGAQHTLLVYQVEGWAYTKSTSKDKNNDKTNDKPESPKSIAHIGTTTSTSDNVGLKVTGVFGLQGDRHQWMKRLTENSSLPIVENGPLSPAGQTAIQFIVDNGEQR